MYGKFDRAYTSAVFAEPLLATTERLLSSGHEFYCYRFDRVSPGAERSGFLAQHTAELRYLFGTLTAEGYDDVDRQVSARMQALWVAFARDGAPTEDGSWPRYDHAAAISVIASAPGQGRIDDDPIVPLVHARRAIARWEPGLADPDGGNDPCATRRYVATSGKLRSTLADQLD